MVPVTPSAVANSCNSLRAAAGSVENVTCERLGRAASWPAVLTVTTVCVPVPV